jgi:hypothetical protein
MNENSIRAKHHIYSLIAKFWKEYKVYIIILSILFLLAFVTGILTCSKYSDIIEIDRLIDKYLLKFLKLEITFFSYFIYLTIFFLIYTLFVIFFTRNKFFIVVDIIIFLLLSYIFGFDLFIIISTLGLAGIICGVLFRAILGIVLFYLIILIISIAIKRYKMRYYCISHKEIYKAYLILILFSIVTIFLFAIMFSVIHIFVIID